VKHRTDSDAPVNASADKVPYCGKDFGHCTTALSTKKKKARVVMAVLTNADQIMNLCESFSINIERSDYF